MSSMSSEKQDANKSLVQNIQESVTLLGSIATGALLASAYYMGRQYLVGYFEAQNIHISLMNVTIWFQVYRGWRYVLPLLLIPIMSIVFLNFFQLPFRAAHTSFRLQILILISYAILGVLYLIFAPVIYRVDSLLIWAILVSLILFFYIVRRRSNQAKQGISSYTDSIDFEQFQENFHFAYLILLSSILFLLLLNFLGDRAYYTGIQAGIQNTKSNVHQVQLVADEPLLLDMPNVITTTIGSDTIYLYAGLRMLTFNDGRYFLYTSLNKECKPEQVYIINEDQLRDVQMNIAPTIMSSCQFNAANAEQSTVVSSPAPPSETQQSSP